MNTPVFSVECDKRTQRTRTGEFCSVFMFRRDQRQETEVFGMRLSGKRDNACYCRFHLSQQTEMRNGQRPSRRCTLHVGAREGRYTNSRSAAIFKMQFLQFRFPH
jgi:hypothetical protein